MAELDPPDAVVATLRSAGCVFAEDEARLLVGAAAGPAELAAMLERRVAGHPLEHILGWVEFCGRRIAVDPGVFVPRQRTQLLAHRAVELARASGRHPVAVDLCCGSGAVAAVLAASVDGIEVHAADVDPAAVRCARRNVPPPGRVYRGDLYDALPDPLRGGVTVLVANAPYVPTTAVALMPPEARLYEPMTALDGGTDGLDLLRRVITGAPGWLAPRGHVLVESGEEQVPALCRAMADAGLAPEVVTDEETGATVVTGSRHRR